MNLCSNVSTTSSTTGLESSVANGARVAPLCSAQTLRVGRSNQTTNCVIIVFVSVPPRCRLGPRPWPRRPAFCFMHLEHLECDL